MPRDYKTRATAKKKKSLPGYIWLLSGLAIGLFSLTSFDANALPATDNNFGDAIQQELKKLKQQANKKDSKKTAAAKKPETTEKKETKFNFYTILPERQVLIPESETRPPETKTSPTTNSKNKAAKKQYVLQVGSFQNLGDAKKLKANLAFLGLSANIQHVTVNRQAWHRVRTGPYKNRQQLYKNQKLLKKNNISSMPMELK